MIAEESEVVEQPGNLRVVAVGILELQRQAFGEIAREHTGWVEALQLGEHALDENDGRAEPHGDIVETARQVAQLVQHVNEVHADQPFGRVRHHQVQLLGEVVGQRARRGNELLEVGVLGAVSVVLARLDGRPAGLVAPRAVSVQWTAPPARLGGRLAARLAVLRGAFRFIGLPGGLVPLQERVALQLVLNEHAEIEIGQLQEANSLLQLGGHHQLLALSQLQLRR